LKNDVTAIAMATITFEYGRFFGFKKTMVYCTGNPPPPNEILTRGLMALSPAFYTSVSCSSILLVFVLLYYFY
jgi:hypothetical protein